MTSPVNPGKVVWSGDNPGIYLKDASGAWQTLSVFFRVVTSPHGPGTGALVLGDPFKAAGWPEARNLCLSNNEPLMRWLVDEFVSRFASFRGASGLQAMTYLKADHMTSRAEGTSFHEEQLAGGGASLALRVLPWRQWAAVHDLPQGRPHGEPGRRHQFPSRTTRGCGRVAEAALGRFGNAIRG